MQVFTVFPDFLSSSNKALVYAQTVEEKSVHQTSQFLMYPLQPYLIMKGTHFF